MEKNRLARRVIFAIVAIGVVVAGGLHYFAEHGQWTPASTTNNATKADQIKASASGQPIEARK